MSGTLDDLEFFFCQIQGREGQGEEVAEKHICGFGGRLNGILPLQSRDQRRAHKRCQSWPSALYHNLF